MNWKSHRLALLFSVALPLTSSLAFAQGSLTPPGPPGPTMKTLDQLEPRTPIGAAPFTITNSGSFYLTGNLTGVSGKAGIVIQADNVTLDLAGFALLGVEGSLAGIDVPSSQQNVAIRNGTVRGWGDEGIAALNTVNSQVEQVRATHNGGSGIELGNAGRVSQCLAGNNGGDGIRVGISTAVSECTASANTSAGINATDASAVQHCTSTGNKVHGIQVGVRCLITDNTCRSNTGGAGLVATGAANRLENNHLVGNLAGLRIDGAFNVVAGNTVRANTVNYVIAAGNQLNLLLCEIPQNIDWPANVTLAGSLTGLAGLNGLGVNADDVTIDLSGFTLVGVPGALSGIVVSGVRKNLTVRNGTVRGWVGSGIAAANVENSLFEDLRLSNNGDAGLAVGVGAIVKNCVARANGNGIVANFGGLVSGCVATSNNSGIIGVEGAMVTGCTVNYNKSDGILVLDDCQVVGNTCVGNSNNRDAAGIHVMGTDNSIRENYAKGNERGISVDAAGNFIVKNTAANNSLNYFIADEINQTLGKIMKVGDNIDAAPAWANFEF